METFRLTEANGPIFRAILKHYDLELQHKTCSTLLAIVTRMKHLPCPYIYTVVSPENVLSCHNPSAYLK